MAVLVQGADEVREERRAGFVNFLLDVVRNSVRARGGRARGLSEGGGDFFLAYREVVGVVGEVDLCQSWRQGGRKEVVKESRIDAVRCVLVREGGKVVFVTEPPGPRNQRAPGPIPRPAPVQGPGRGCFFFALRPCPCLGPRPVQGPRQPPVSQFPLSGAPPFHLFPAHTSVL